jgi:hypothetical protein
MIEKSITLRMAPIVRQLKFVGGFSGRSVENGAGHSITVQNRQKEA